MVNDLGFISLLLRGNVEFDALHDVFLLWKLVLIIIRINYMLLIILIQIYYKPYIKLAMSHTNLI